MIDPEDMPDEVLWELSDPNSDYDLMEESAYYAGSIGVYEDSYGNVTDYGRKESNYHDNIKTGQKLRAAYFNELIPSKAEKTWWLYAESKKKHKKATKRSGKWCCFVKPEFIDAAWEQVKDATEQGLLGADSKCSTKKGFKGTDYVIIVYTYDWRDEKDVMRVREVLRELGFTKPLPYKTDEDTLKNRYAHNSKNISKYYE